MQNTGFLSTFDINNVSGAHMFTNLTLRLRLVGSINL